MVYPSVEEKVLLSTTVEMNSGDETSGVIPSKLKLPMLQEYVISCSQDG